MVLIAGIPQRCDYQSGPGNARGLKAASIGEIRRLAVYATREKFTFGNVEVARYKVTEEQSRNAHRPLLGALVVRNVSHSLLTRMLAKMKLEHDGSGAR